MKTDLGQPHPAILLSVVTADCFPGDVRPDWLREPWICRVLPCLVVASFGNLEVVASGQVFLPEAVRDRWGLLDGSVLDYLDLGGAS